MFYCYVSNISRRLLPTTRYQVVLMPTLCSHLPHKKTALAQENICSSNMFRTTHKQVVCNNPMFTRASDSITTTLHINYIYIRCLRLTTKPETLLIINVAYCINLAGLTTECLKKSIGVLFYSHSHQVRAI